MEIKELQDQLTGLKTEPKGYFDKAASETKNLGTITEELKTMPFGAVWDHYCVQNDVPVGMAWLDEAVQYEKKVLSKR